jgi:hypothetical protein
MTELQPFSRNEEGCSKVSLSVSVALCGRTASVGEVAPHAIPVIIVTAMLIPIRNEN